jgi:hypothetical protein
MHKYPAGESPPVVFQHIPKTAGVVVRSIIGCNFHVDSIASVGDAFWMDKQLAADLVRRKEFIHGHLHREFFVDIVDRIRLITFLRDPVERVKSLYWFLRKQHPVADAAPWVISNLEFAKTRSLLEFVSSSDPNLLHSISNFQLRMILTLQQQATPISDWVDHALENHTDYDFIGFTDLMADSMAVMARRFGWISPGRVPRANRSERGQNECDDDLADEIIRSLNEQEILFYSRMRREFESTVQADNPRTPERPGQPSPGRPYTTGLTSPISMKEPLRCWGWHDRESNAAGEYWRCAGALTAGFELRVEAGGDFLLSIEVPAVSPRIELRETILFINSRRARYYIWQGGARTAIIVSVDREMIGASGLIAVGLEFSERPPSPTIAGAITDDRFTTIAVGTMEIVRV